MKMPAGRYYVGDLCYVWHDEWDEFCNITIEGGHILDGVFSLKDGRQFATFGTMYGDGGYSDQNGSEYGVDAGLIGCVLVSDIDLSNTNNDMDGGNVIEFSEDFEVSESNGIIRFGHIVIDTSGLDDESD
jgi:hypothetical protein